MKQAISQAIVCRLRRMDTVNLDHESIPISECRLGRRRSRRCGGATDVATRRRGGDTAAIVSPASGECVANVIAHPQFWQCPTAGVVSYGARDFPAVWQPETVTNKITSQPANVRKYLQYMVHLGSPLFDRCSLNEMSISRSVPGTNQDPP